MICLCNIHNVVYTLVIANMQSIIEKNRFCFHIYNGSILINAGENSEKQILISIKSRNRDYSRKGK